MWSGKTCSGREKRIARDRDGDKQKARERERQRDRERKRKRERESVVNGEQRVFQSGFRPLFVLRLPQLWRKNRKEREKKEEKGERDRDKASTQNVL